MIGGATPTFQIMRGVAGGRGLNHYTHNGGSNLRKKILEKSLDGIRIIFYLWRVGGFVPIYIGIYLLT
jgi:hypothetical protein